MEDKRKDVIACPHCPVTYDHNASMKDRAAQIDDARGRWYVQTTKCPSCENFRISILCIKTSRKSIGAMTPRGFDKSEIVVEGDLNYQRVVYPFPATRTLPKEVPDYVKQDYFDAIATLELSTRASAACSRRCMQTIIRRHFNIVESTLYHEIEKLKQNLSLPAPMIEMLHMIRDYGNFGAHPIQGNAGEIIDVEEGEAAFMIELLEQLIDQSYVRPAALQKAKAALEAKKPKKHDELTRN